MVHCQKCGSVYDDGDDYCRKCGERLPKRTGCFIATACYGERSEEVKIFRNWRDKRLLTNSLGRIFVTTYYKTSPPIANFISNKPLLKKVVRMSLQPIKEIVR